MIVRMKKVVLLCVASDRRRTLEELRELGLLQLSHVRTPAGADLDRARAQAADARRAGEVLKAWSPPPQATPDSDAQRLPARVLDLQRRRQALADELDGLSKESDRLRPFGSFDPGTVRELERRGTSVRLYQATEMAKARPSDGAHVQVLGEGRQGVCFALIGIGPISCAGASEFALPARSLAAVEDEIRVREAEMRDLESELASLSGSLSGLSDLERRLAEEVDLLEAREGMGEAERVVYLQGFCPVTSLRRLQSAVAVNGWGLRVSDPDPTDSAPTLLHMPKWVRPMESLFALIKILPGYREVDVSASFLIFLSVFFAMIVGDAGYGFIFLLAAAWAHLKLRGKSPAAPFVLIYIFSVCTVIWGVLSGTYFGLSGDQLPALVKRVNWLGNEKNVMGLCLLIGGIHLTVAHAWNVVRYINTLQALAQAGWIAITWALYFAAKTMLLGSPFPVASLALGGLGLLCVIFFMTPRARLKAEWVNHAMLPLSIMSNFGDVLSYMRLFALGVAGVQLAGAFNQIALTIGFSSPVAGFLASVVLLLGHALNIVLSAMSVLVHGIRLNALEFSMHMGLEWSGSPFRPFARRRSPA